MTAHDPGGPTYPARHNRLGEELIYRLLIEWPMRQQFSRVWLRLDGPLPHPADGPLICYVTHSSWWDGYVAQILHRKLFRRTFQGFLMMDQQQLQHYSFFTWLGVFSIDRRSASAARRSVEYIARKLGERCDRYVWIFPQGEILPAERRPLRLYPGMGQIARLAGGAQLWPVALRYEFRTNQRPELFIRCGPAHAVAAEASERATTRDAQQRLATLADALRADIRDDQLQGYRPLMQGMPGIDRIGGALLDAFRPPRRRAATAAPPQPVPAPQSPPPAGSPGQHSQP